MTTPYQPTAGPSRYHNPGIPPRPPSKSLSPSYSPQPEPWTNGNGTMAMLEPNAGYHTGQREGAAKRNPLLDLIDSEKIYVEQLGLVIRRVAAAWSRKDFPPAKLDAMFRCAEAVYRANRAFGNRLKEIGPNPSSPKALGDLLMRWIDDLEPSYQKYATTFMTGFDSYPPVSRNPLLPNILVDISASSSPTPPLAQWSLDALFILPYARLRYYRKLYARLLRSTKEGRSDYRLLVVANRRLETLVSEVETRLEVDVGEDDAPNPAVLATSGDRSREQSWQVNERVSRSSSTMNSSVESHSNISPFSSRIEDPRNSGGSPATSVNQSPKRRPTVTVPSMNASSISTSTTGTAPLSDLELRIDPGRALDLFTMMPKKCKLQINPPSLPFTRQLRSSHDATIYFSPGSTGDQVVHHRAHVFILSDLFLVAEWMELSDKAAKAQQVAKEQPERVGQGGPMPEMWLSYPPLAGKHLSVSEGAHGNVIALTIMRKETFIIHVESEVARDNMFQDLVGCIDFASSVSRPPTTDPSPGAVDIHSPSSFSDTRSGESTFPPLRYPSPFSPESSPSASPRPSEVNAMPPPPMGGNVLLSQISTMSLEPREAVSWSQGPTPPPSVLPLPGSSSALPPRGASLRSRGAPNNLPVPPQLPHLPFTSVSDSALPMVPGAPLPRSPSGRSVQSAPRPMRHDIPPVPQFRGAGSHLSDGSFASHHPPSRSHSADPLRPPEPPSARFSSFPGRGSPADVDDDSPPMSPVEEEEAAALTGPAVISAQMKCKVFLKQSHQQWKSLGSGRLKLYAQKRGNIKQLVVESDSSSKAMLISTIVLTDGVERVAKTGVAVEISDKGKRTGIIYMIQLRNENSAAGLFESLLAGSDRSAVPR